MQFLVMLIMFGAMLFLNLLPYYVAYLIISPDGFMGIVGVFVLGSIIVPITVWASVLIFAAIAKVFERN